METTSSMEDSAPEAPKRRREPIAVSTLDAILTAQIAVAWAGEGGEEPRLAWWRCDLASEFGGEYLFKDLLPHTWRWAVLQSVREAARRHDEKLRRDDHDPDSIVSLYNLGFDLEERLDERFADLKRSGLEPLDTLTGLREVFEGEWDRSEFDEWLAGHGTATHKAVPVGRLLKGDAPGDPERAVQQLVAAFQPLSDRYPLPHYRRKA